MKLLLLLCFFVSTAFAQSITYPLVCRGGFTFSKADFQDGYPSIRFTKAAAAAGETGANLEPGECAWVDRALYPDEPTSIAFYNFNPRMFCEPYRTGTICHYGLANHLHSFEIMFQNCALNKDCILTTHIYRRLNTFFLDATNPRAFMKLR